MYHVVLLPCAHGNRVVLRVVVGARPGRHRRCDNAKGLPVSELVDPRGQRRQSSLLHATLILVVGAGLEVLLQLVAENVVDQMHLHR